METGDILEILKILPHRYPFLLIDRVTKIDPVPSSTNWSGRSVEAIKNVTYNENFFTGHFPHRPVMPGVLIIEAMAQTAGVCAHRPGLKKDVMIASIKDAKFRKPVIPGDTLRIVATCVKDRGLIYSFKCQAFVGEQVVAEAELLAMYVDKKD